MVLLGLIMTILQQQMKAITSILIQIRQKEVVQDPGLFLKKMEQ
jgi:hypothetical protein